MRGPAATVGWSRGTWLLRALLLVLPGAALLLAVQGWPPLWVAVLVVAGSVRWAWLPDDLVGALLLLLVAVRCVVDDASGWGVAAAGVLLVAAHLAATVASYGPGTLGPERALVLLWVRRGLLTLVPLGVAVAAVGLLEADLAPGWLWTLTLAITAALVLLAARVTQRVKA